MSRSLGSPCTSEPPGLLPRECPPHEHVRPGLAATTAVAGHRGHGSSGAASVGATTASTAGYGMTSVAVSVLDDMPPAARRVCAPPSPDRS